MRGAAPALAASFPPSGSAERESGKMLQRLFLGWIPAFAIAARE
jgi:hypothetical protein